MNIKAEILIQMVQFYLNKILERNDIIETKLGENKELAIKSIIADKLERMER